MDMINDSNRGWYTAKDIKKFFGVSSGQLFHWGRTWGLISPALKAKGRAFKDKYDFNDLLDIALVKELTVLGFEPGQIKNILKKYDKPFLPKSWGKSIWNPVREARDDYEQEADKKVPSWEETGYLLMIFKYKNGYTSYEGDPVDVFKYLGQEFKERDIHSSASYILIDLIKILKDVKAKTGEIF